MRVHRRLQPLVKAIGNVVGWCRRKETAGRSDKLALTAGVETAAVELLGGSYPVVKEGDSGIPSGAAVPVDGFVFFLGLLIAARVKGAVAVALALALVLSAELTSPVPRVPYAASNNSSYGAGYDSNHKQYYSATEGSSSSSSGEDDEAVLDSPSEFANSLEQYLRSVDLEDLYYSEALRRVLGSGTFGECCLLLVPCPQYLEAAAQAAGQLELGGVPVVMKYMQRSGSSIDACKSEAGVYEAASSPYLPRLYCHSHSERASILVFKAVSSNPCNLSDWVYECAAAAGNSPKHLSVGATLGVLLYVSRGMRDLNAVGLCQGDVKPDNIVLGRQAVKADNIVLGRQAYMVDMGLVLERGTQLGGWAWGTYEFMDPMIELAHMYKWDLQVEGTYDYFSLGLVLVFMLCRGDYHAVARAKEIAVKVMSGRVLYEEGEEKMAELLGGEMAAVMGDNEVELQQAGLLDTRLMRAGAEQMMYEIVSGLLLK